MYKVIIADDEQAVRDRLTSLLKRASGIFEIVGSYSNGYDALENGIVLKPDLIITDIKMPYISGIDLLKQARQELPLVQSIIISGYDSFDYAKQAIQIGGVIGYISKPITFEELNANLVKAKETIDKNLNINRNIRDLQSQAETGLKVIQENDLIRLMTMKDIPKNFLEKLSIDKIDLSYRYQMVALFDPDTDIDQIPYDKQEILIAYVKKYIEEAFSGYLPFYLFTMDDYICLLLASNDKFSYDDITSKLNFILANVNNVCEMSVSVGISNIMVDRNLSYRKIYRHAKRSLEYRTVIGTNMVLLYDDLMKKDDKDYPTGKIDDNEYKSINYEISYGKEEDAKKRIRKMLTKISSPSYSDTYYFILSNILDTILKSCVSLRTLYKAAGGMVELSRKLYSLKNPTEIYDFLSGMVNLVVKVNMSSRMSGVESSFLRIKAFVETNYTKYDLSLENVANELCYSVSYISAILKRNGTSFTKYLTGIRMEKAKVLLADKDAKIINVASEVGYQDPYYFSHCFKKYYGVSPDEFRKK